MVHNLRFMVKGLVLDAAPDVRHWLLLHFERVVVAQHRGGEGERVLARCRLLHTQGGPHVRLRGLGSDSMCR